MTSGFGNTPFGLFGFGLSDPGTAVPLGGMTQSARDLDPSTKDFYADSDGRLTATTPVRQRVILALASTKGSSAILPELGNNIMNMKWIDDKSINKAKAYIRDALKDLVTDKSITISNIEVSNSGLSRLSYEVTYIDLTTNTLDVVSNQF